MADQDETRDPPEPPTATQPESASAGTRDFPGPAADAVPSGTYAQTPHEAAASAAHSASATIPGYELLGELGRGGMGVVYRARDTRLNREVALKTLLSADASRILLARFWAEAEVMAALKHPHVVQVYELGEHQNRPFMVMEFVAGGSLERYVSNGPFAPREAAELLAKVASGVAAAHALGIVHRDLKPANVLVAPDGTPKVTDFGIAKRDAHDLTQTQALMGTPAYMAPEQAAGRAKFVGPPADVWALGVILYECVTGRRPFEGDTREALLSDILSAEPKTLRTSLAGAPRDLDTIVAKCLSKEPEHRYPTAAELADDLNRFVRGEPIAARPVGPVERLARWARRKPTAAAAYGFSALAALLAVGVFVVFGFWRAAERANTELGGAKTELESTNGRLADEKKRADAARDDALRLKGVADLARDDANRSKGVAEEQKLIADRAKAAETELRKEREVFEYGRTVQVAAQEVRDNNVASARAILDRTPVALRGWEWHYVHRLANASVLTLPSIGGRFAAFSPDGARVVTSGRPRAKVGANEEGAVWDASTGVELFALKGFGHALVVAPFSADGSRLLASSENGFMKVLDAATGAEVSAFKAGGELRVALISADGTRVFTAPERKLATMWDAKTGKELFSFKAVGGPVQSAAMSTDGTRLVTAGGNPEAGGPSVVVWDTKTGDEICRLKPRDAGVPLAFSPDGTRFATADEGNTVRIWNAKTGAELQTLTGHTVSVEFGAFSPNGALFVTATDDRTVRVWDVKTGAAVCVIRSPNRFYAAAFHPDGTRVATAGEDKTARLWDAKTGAELATFTGHTAGVLSVSFNRDGTRLLTASTDGTARVWNVAGRTDSTVLKGHTNRLVGASFSPNGKLIATPSTDHKVKVWSAATGAELYTITEHTISVQLVAFSSDGSRLLTSSPGERTHLWDAKTGAKIRTLAERDREGRTYAPINAAAFGPDGTRVVTGGRESKVRVWDVATGAELLQLECGLKEVGFVAYSPDGTRIYTPNSVGGKAEGGRLWDAKTGAEIAILKGHTAGVREASFSTDGPLLVTSGNDYTPRVWDTTTGAEIAAFKGHTGTVFFAGFSPDGTRVLTASYDGTARVWDAKTGTALLTLKGHTARVWSAAYNTDATRIVTASDDDTARVWDAKTGAEVFALKGHTGVVTAASFSSDGWRIVTASGDRTARVWDATPLDRRP